MEKSQLQVDEIFTCWKIHCIYGMYNAVERHPLTPYLLDFMDVERSDANRTGGATRSASPRAIDAVRWRFDGGEALLGTDSATMKGIVEVTKQSDGPGDLKGVFKCYSSLALLGTRS